MKKKKLLDKKRSQCRIYIGNCIDDWRSLREELNFSHDSDLCRYLLTMYEENTARAAIPMTSTPIQRKRSFAGAQKPSETYAPKMLQLEKSSTITKEPVIEMDLSCESETEKADYYQARLSTTKDSSLESSSLLLDPDDPSIHLSRLTEDTEESVDYVSYVSSNQRITEQADEIDKLNMLLITEENLKQLGNKMTKKCFYCSKWEKVEIEKIGTACIMKWACEDGHVGYKWHSQPQVKYGTYVGDILVSAATLLSGNNFEKQKLFFHFLKVEKFVDSKFFNALQQQIICPVIEEYWKALQLTNIQALHGQDVILCGDGRNDSPGFCSQYCTYTVMSHDSLDILALVVIDKRQVDLKSPNMERLGFQTALDLLLHKGVNVKEVVTDQHPGIIGLMKRRYPDIYHSFDIWHVAKNLGKSLAKAAARKKCKPLLPWIPDIVRHFWWVSRECSGSVIKFKEMWRGVLHHVQGHHQWTAFNGDETGCKHSEDFKERDHLLKPGTPAFKSLSQVVLDKRFLRQVAYFVRFRRNGEIETFNHLILKYCSKQYAFGYPAYTARNQLAAIDYTEHKNRNYAYKEDMTPKLNRRYNKSTGRWVVTHKKVPKTYDYANSLLKNVFVKKMDFKGTRSKKHEMKADDPRRIAPRIAPTEPSSSRQIFEDQKSRFKEVKEKI